MSFFPPIQCYYIGAADISATKLVREVTRPLSFGKPNEKICEDMKKKDEQICELRYGKLWGDIGAIQGWSVCPRNTRILRQETHSMLLGVPRKRERGPSLMTNHLSP